MVSQGVFSVQILPTFIPALEITELNPYILTKSALSTDVEGKDSQEGGMHDEGAAAVQHLVQVRCLERHTGVLWNSTHRLAGSKGEELSGRELTPLPSSECM